MTSCIGCNCVRRRRCKGYETTCYIGVRSGLESCRARRLLSALRTDCYTLLKAECGVSNLGQVCGERRVPQTVLLAGARLAKHCGCRDSCWV